MNKRSKEAISKKEAEKLSASSKEAYNFLAT